MEHKLEDRLCWNSPRRRADILSTLGEWTLDLDFKPLAAVEFWQLTDEAPEFERDLEISVAANVSQADCTRSLCISFSSCVRKCLKGLLNQCVKGCQQELASPLKL